MNGPAPAPLIPLPEITRMAFAGVDLAPLGAELLERLRSDPADAPALMDLSRVLLARSLEASLTAQRQALALSQLYHVRRPSQKASLRLLALLAPGDPTANTPIEYLLDGSDVALDVLYLGDGLPLPVALPEHDALFIGIGECDGTRALLQFLAGFLSAWPRPVINAPARILDLSRDGAGRMLAGLPGVEVPLATRLERRQLAALGRGEIGCAALRIDGDFPLIARPVGSHMGQGLARLDGPQAIGPFLDGCPAAELFVSRFVDYAGADGRYRKYRVVLIDGRPFACHLAVGDDWLVHYQKAGMEQSADKRAEEEAFMARFDHDFAARHRLALTAIAARAGLDYLGIDCAESRDGRLLVFEIDNAVLVHAMDPVDRFPYKQPAMRRLFAAFAALLRQRVS